MCQTRCIFLGQPLTTPLGGFIVGLLLSYYFSDIAEYRNRPIFVYINSCGGAIMAGLSIYDTIMKIKERVYTTGLGIVASTSTLVLIAGAYSFRYAAPNSRIMIHQPRARIRHEAAWRFVRNAEFVTQLRKHLLHCYAMRTPQHEPFIDRALDVYTFMSPEEAINFGLVDRIGLANWAPNKEDPPFEIPEEGNEGFELAPPMVLEAGRISRRIRLENPKLKVKRIVGVSYLDELREYEKQLRKQKEIELRRQKRERKEEERDEEE
uniref:ATP-dependent Clp protease proteolytic subunit n=1 Tax=Gnetum ula TaxID=3383 RepID=N0DUD5_9SPER|nr:ATP-dependent Clp protease proteolytic subunit [Gnetum ula]BAN16907.1 ATP-dependent Clp protease proteolytic subunit [Gnetum ula]BAT70169.1 ATP-dependent Clp protease proteolytic subunit [Gnetum ula]